MTQQDIDDRDYIRKEAHSLRLLTPYQRLEYKEEMDSDETEEMLVDYADRALIEGYLQTGSKVKAARMAGIVRQDASYAEAAKAATKRMNKDGFTQYLFEQMNAIDLRMDDILAVLKRNLGAMRIEVNSRTGAIVNLGPDVRGSNEAARILLTLISMESSKTTKNKTSVGQVNNFTWNAKPLSEVHGDIVDATAYEVTD